MESLNGGQLKRRDETGIKIRLVVTWSIGLILFITVVAYAGVRGQNAYNQSPSLEIVTQQRTAINFPAVTACPIVPARLVQMECIKEMGTTMVADCSSTVYQRPFQIEGAIHQCLTFNDPQDGTPVFTSSSSADEFAIKIAINVSDIPQGEPIGVLIIVHEQQTAPILEEEASFLANVGEITQGWLQLSEFHRINGLQELDFKVVASAANAKEIVVGENANIVDIDFVFPRQEVIVNTEYYNYIPDNWIGEVGGLAFLLWFLHWSVTAIILFVISRIRKQPYNPYSTV